MIPAVSAPAPVAKGAQTSTGSSSGDAASTRQGAQTGSAGEVAAAKVRTETTRAVDPARQAAAAPRMRDQETAEQSDRAALPDTGPTGPRPAFQETFLQRAARLALTPPKPEGPSPTAGQTSDAPPDQDDPETPVALRPTTSDMSRARDGFSQTQQFVEARAPSVIDFRG